MEKSNLTQITFFEMSPFVPEKQSKGRGAKFNQFLTVRKEGLNISGMMDDFLGNPEFVSVATGKNNGIFGIKKVNVTDKTAVPVDRNIHNGRGRSVRINRKKLSEVILNIRHFDSDKFNLQLTEYTINNDGYVCFDLNKGVEVERRN